MALQDAAPALKFGVVLFPGSNCDHDAVYALRHNLGQQADLVWHESEDLSGFDAVLLPGGFFPMATTFVPAPLRAFRP